jgi:hypothetical protein
LLKHGDLRDDPLKRVEDGVEQRHNENAHMPLGAATHVCHRYTISKKTRPSQLLLSDIW